MKSMNGMVFHALAWIVLLAAFVAAVVQMPSDPSPLLMAAGAIGAIGLADSISRILKDRKDNP